MPAKRRASRRAPNPRTRREELLVRAHAFRYEPGTTLEPHTHDWAQLVYASEGVMTVSTREGSWVVPPQRAVWIPAGVEHSIGMSGRVLMQSLYFTRQVARGLAGRCRVLSVSPLLRQLVPYAVARAPLRGDAPEHRRLCAFLLDQLALEPQAALELPAPRDRRALRLAERLRASPGETLPLARLAREAGASLRTAERLFRVETGMTLGRWRQQARLLGALRLLASGEPVTAVAQEVGYASTSAFIAAFRRALGTTPSRYYRGSAAGGSSRRSTRSTSPLAEVATSTSVAAPAGAGGKRTTPK